MRLLTVLLAVLFVLALPGLAMAETKGEFSKTDMKGMAGLMLIPALLLLLALPAVVVYRALTRHPESIADTLGERPVVSVVLGVGNLTLLILLTTAAKAAPGIGVIVGMIWMVFLVVTLVGFVGAATHLARRFRADAGVGTFALAWLTISGVSLLPVLGFLYLVWLMSAAIGGTLLTLYAWRRTAK